MLPTAMQGSVLNKVGAAIKRPMQPKPRAGQTPPIVAMPPTGPGGPRPRNPIDPKPPIRPAGQPPGVSTMPRTGNVLPAPMGGPQAMGMGRGAPNAPVFPGDLGPGSVTGPTSQLNAPAGPGTSLPPNPPVGTAPPGGFSSPTGGPSTGPEGFDAGGDGTGVPVGATPPAGPPGVNYADIMGRQQMAGSMFDALKAQTHAGEDPVEYQQSVQKAMAMLPPAMRLAVTNGHMSIGGALARYRQRLMGMGQPQGA